MGKRSTLHPRRNAFRTGVLALCRAGTPLLPLSAAALMAIGATTPASAQEYRGTIQGNVSDGNGYAIGGAAIVAKSAEQEYKVTGDTKGYFVIPFVQPGTYTVTVQAPGFKTEVRQGLIVDVSQRVNVPLAMSAGGVTDVVTVRTDGPQLATTDASGGTVMDPEKVQNLPLNGRQVYSLLALTPGVRFTVNTFGPGGYSGTRGWDTSNAYSITGQPGSYTQFLLNGAPISQQGGGGAGTWNISPTIDAIQEFKVMTITFDAQYGRVGGGAVNTILKNGTPHFHGTLYDFWRNSALDANTYQLNQQRVARPYHNQHQFGGTVGGPFLKKNAFFFFSYEGWREVLPGSVVTTVPTADLLPNGSGNVDLTNYLAGISRTGGIYDPNTTACAVPSGNGGCTTYTRTAFANNIIPANRISPIGVNILKLFPAPNRAGYQNNYVYNGKDAYRYNMPIARADYNFSDRTKLYGIFAWWAGHENRNGNGFPGPAEQGNVNNYRASITQVLDLTHTFSSRIVGDVRASFNRYYTLAPNGSLSARTATLSAAALGLNMPKLPTTANTYAPQISIGDGYPGVIGNVADPSIFETYDLGPSITQTVGRHTLHYGGEFSLYHDIAGGIGQPNGNFGFGTGFTQKNPFQGNQDGSAIAETLLGYAGGGSVQYSFAPYESYKYFGFFAQDDWKVSSKVAINAGLRWDEELSPVERQPAARRRLPHLPQSPIGPGRHSLYRSGPIREQQPLRLCEQHRLLSAQVRSLLQPQPRLGPAWRLHRLEGTRHRAWRCLRLQPEHQLQLLARRRPAPGAGLPQRNPLSQRIHHAPGNLAGSRHAQRYRLRHRSARSKDPHRAAMDLRLSNVTALRHHRRRRLPGSAHHPAPRLQANQRHKRVGFPKGARRSQLSQSTGAQPVLWGAGEHHRPGKKSHHSGEIPQGALPAVQRQPVHLHRCRWIQQLPSASGEDRQAHHRQRTLDQRAEFPRVVYLVETAGFHRLSE